MQSPFTQHVDDGMHAPMHSFCIVAARLTLQPSATPPLQLAKPAVHEIVQSTLHVPLIALQHVDPHTCEPGLSG